MKICVCVNPVPDFGNKCIITNGMPEYGNIVYYIDEYDMAAYQTALLLKKRYGFSVTILAVKNDSYEKCLKRLRAYGADRCVWLKIGQETIDNCASVMSSFLKVNQHDIVLTGAFSHNFSTSGFAAILAGNVKNPLLSNVISIDYFEDDKNFIIKKKSYDHTIEEYKTSGKFHASVISAETSVNYPAAINLMQSDNNAIDYIENITSSVECSDESCSSFRDPVSDVTGTFAAGSDKDISMKLIKLIDKKEILLR